MDNQVEYLYSKFLQSDGVSIDTRTLEPDNLFFGIVGEHMDGGKYAEQALEKGASFAVVQDEKYVTDPRIIFVPDCQKALQELAIFHRGRFNKKKIVFGLTGSNGKTTTKELIYRVLDKKYIVHATKGNYNNHLGVPLTILDIIPQVEIAIIEMGANRVGDIAELCGYANPTHGLITNIGLAHTETFGGFEGVIRGKSELFDHLRKNNGQVFINEEDTVLANMAKRFPEAVSFPTPDVVHTSSHPYVEGRIGEFAFQSKLVGQYNFSNIAAAVAVGRYFGVNDEEIASAIGEYEPSNWRSQLVEYNGLRILLDAYNANPTSMKAAIENLATFEGRKIAILGDMQEVEDEQKAHLEIASLLKEKGIGEAFLVGPRSKVIADNMDDAKWFENKAALESFLQTQKFDNTTILIKASRAAKLESLKDVLLK